MGGGATEQVSLNTMGITGPRGGRDHVAEPNPKDRVAIVTKMDDRVKTEVRIVGFAETCGIG